MNLLTVRVIFCCKVNPLPITQEVINWVEDIANKYGIEYLLKFQNCKEGTVCEDYDENDDNNGSIVRVYDDNEEEYESTKEKYVICDE